MFAAHPAAAPSAQRRAPQPARLGQICARLAEVSARPRYAFLVLGLIAEAADASGRAGPYVGRDLGRGEGRATLRDWIAAELLPLSTTRRGGAGRDEEAALATGEANVSRAVSDLVRAGLVTRHYAGRITNHVNRGGRRLAVYAVTADAMAAVRTRALLV